MGYGIQTDHFRNRCTEWTILTLLSMCVARLVRSAFLVLCSMATGMSPGLDTNFKYFYTYFAEGVSLSLNGRQPTPRGPMPTA
jgi:hypothetical protein